MDLGAFHCMRTLAIIYGSNTNEKGFVRIVDYKSVVEKKVESYKLQLWQEFSTRLQ